MTNTRKTRASKTKKTGATPDPIMEAKSDQIGDLLGGGNLDKLAELRRKALFRMMPIVDILSLKSGKLHLQRADVLVVPSDTDLGLTIPPADKVADFAHDKLREACFRAERVPQGGARIFPVEGKGRLKANFLVPIALECPESPPDEEVLRKGVSRALELAEEAGAASIAFPPLFTPKCLYPLRRCAEIMMTEVKRFFENERKLVSVIIVAEDDRAAASFEECYRQL